MGAGEDAAQLLESEGAGGRWMLPLVFGWAGFWRD